VERGGQGVVRAGLPVSRKIVSPDPADVAGQVHRAARQVLLRMEEDQNQD